MMLYMMLQSFFTDNGDEKIDWKFYLIFLVISLFLLYYSFVINHQTFIKLTYLIVISLLLSFIFGIIQALIIFNDKHKSDRLNNERNNTIGKLNSLCSDKNTDCLNQYQLDMSLQLLNPITNIFIFQFYFLQVLHSLKLDYLTLNERETYSGKKDLKNKSPNL